MIIKINFNSGLTHTRPDLSNSGWVKLSVALFLKTCVEFNTGVEHGLQFSAVRTFHGGIKSYAAMFGSEVKVGLASTFLPKVVFTSIQLKKCLKKLLTGFTSESESSQE